MVGIFGGVSLSAIGNSELEVTGSSTVGGCCRLSGISAWIIVETGRMLTAPSLNFGLLAETH